MAKRTIIFKGGGRELALPVTPDQYQVEKGINVEVVNIHQLGDAILVGYGTLATIKISRCLLPANPYNFASNADSPEAIVKCFEGWIEDKSKLRFVVSGTGVNLPVVVEHISWGERDGTNDVYADVTLREYRKLQPVKVVGPTLVAAAREAEPKTQTSSYAIVYGDTLSAICRQFYGDGSAAIYNKLAAYNNISNPHLIYAGNTLTIPQPL